MVRYDFYCQHCELIREIQRSMKDNSPVYCLQCDREMKQQITPPGIIFKGSGFYSTDLRTFNKRTTRSRKD